MEYSAVDKVMDKGSKAPRFEPPFSHANWWDVYGTGKTLLKYRISLT